MFRLPSSKPEVTGDMKEGKDLGKCPNGENGKAEIPSVEEARQVIARLKREADARVAPETERMRSYVRSHIEMGETEYTLFSRDPVKLEAANRIVQEMTANGYINVRIDPHRPGGPSIRWELEEVPPPPFDASSSTIMVNGLLKKPSYMMNC